MAIAVTQKFLVYPGAVAQFIHLIEMFRERVELSKEDIWYDPEKKMFSCSVFFYEVNDSVLFQNIAVTFIQCKYLDPGIAETS
jgi:hypothetical protein